MKIIGAGFGRTGTYSLRSALDIIGFGPTYHMSELVEQPSHEAVWQAAIAGDPPDWREFLADYQSTMDWPGCLFWKELSETFPDARVVLNTRDPERWYESVRETIMSAHPGHPDHDPAPAGMPELAPMIRVAGSCFVEQFGGFDRFADPETAIAVFQQHYQRVRETVPAERLLEYEVKQGWEPLCAFLGIPVPDEPFPHLNDRQAYKHPEEQLEKLRQRRG